MKINAVADSELPGSLLIRAENDTEILLLREFCNDLTPIAIKNYGGNISEGEWSLLIGHVSSSWYDAKKMNNETLPTP